MLIDILGRNIMKKKILIIEDDKIIRKELQLLLSNQGYDVTSMEQLNDVKKEIQFFNPHLVILDIKLPEKDGYEICREIRDFSKIPIIFVTSIM